MVWHPCWDPVWILHGSCVDPAWILHAPERTRNMKEPSGARHARIRGPGPGLPKASCQWWIRIQQGAVASCSRERPPRPCISEGRRGGEVQHTHDLRFALGAAQAMLVVDCATGEGDVIPLNELPTAYVFLGTQQKKEEEK